MVSKNAVVEATFLLSVRTCKESIIYISQNEKSNMNVAVLRFLKMVGLTLVIETLMTDIALWPINVLHSADIKLADRLCLLGISAE